MEIDTQMNCLFQPMYSIIKVLLESFYCYVIQYSDTHKHIIYICEYLFDLSTNGAVKVHDIYNNGNYPV